jgi:hypothetical protein
MGSARVRHALRRFLRGSRAAYRGDLGVRCTAKRENSTHGQDTRAQFGSLAVIGFVKIRQRYFG